MNNENNHPHWKEIADHLRKLNVDYYWKMLHEKPVSRPLPPPRPCITRGISMAMRQEHTPPVIKRAEEAVSAGKSDNKD